MTVIHPDPDDPGEGRPRGCAVKKAAGNALAVVLLLAVLTGAGVLLAVTVGLPS